MTYHLYCTGTCLPGASAGEQPALVVNKLHSAQTQRSHHGKRLIKLMDLIWCFHSVRQPSRNWRLASVGQGTSECCYSHGPSSTRLRVLKQSLVQMPLQLRLLTGHTTCLHHACKSTQQCLPLTPDMAQPACITYASLYNNIFLLVHICRVCM